MGKLTITGKASHEYPYDQLEITVQFQVHEKSSSAALEKTLQQCEEFLSILNKEGISMESIHIGKDSVNQKYKDVCAIREIKIRVPFSMEFTNHFMTLIQNKKYNVDIDTQYILSNRTDIHNDLIKEAIDDSKKKASLIVEAMGQKLIGIDSVEIGDRYGRDTGDMFLDSIRAITSSTSLHYSNMIQAPVTEESESVEVVWLIE
ncbi:MAG: SIMPL domain-containing protein [Acutalibacteraceae bacterium]